MLVSLLILLGGCAPPDPSVTGRTPPSFEKQYIPRHKPCPPKNIECPEQTPCEKLLELDELIDIALLNNPLTKQSWHIARAAAYNLGISESALYPNVVGTETITAPANYGSSGTIISGGTTTDLVVGGRGFRGRSSGKTPFVTSDITVSYLLLDFGGRCAQIEASRQALLAADWMHSRTIQSVILSVLQGYYNYLNAIGILEARENDLKDSGTNLESAKAQFEAGVVMKVDVLQAQSNYVNSQLQVETARGQVHTTRGQLATALGWPANTKVCVVPLPEKLSLDVIQESLCTLLEIAKLQRPDLIALYAQFLEAKAEVTVAESSGRPTLTITGDTQRTDFINQPSFNNSSQTAALALNVPIFAGWLYENQTASAKETALAAYASWKNQEEVVLLNVLTSYYAYTTAIETVQFSEEYLAFAQEAYEAAHLGYKMGTNSIIDLIAAQVTLSNARTQRIQARTQFLTSIANVAYSIGKL